MFFFSNEFVCKRPLGEALPLSRLVPCLPDVRAPTEERAWPQVEKPAALVAQKKH